jgi:hypothetical protein
VHPHTDVHVRPADLARGVGRANLRQVAGVSVEQAGAVHVQARRPALEAEAGTQERRPCGARPRIRHHVVPVVHCLDRPQPGRAQSGLLPVQDPHCGRDLVRAKGLIADLEQVRHCRGQPGHGVRQERHLSQRFGVRGIPSVLLR